MKGKAFVLFLLAVVVGSCPCLASLGSSRETASGTHACCKGADEQGTPGKDAPDSGNPECCLRAPAPAFLSLFEFRLEWLGETVAAAGATPPAPQRRLDSTAPSPHGGAPPLGVASPRAPPTLD